MGELKHFLFNSTDFTGLYLLTNFLTITVGNLNQLIMSDYIPHTDDDRLTWNNNMKSKIATQGPVLGLTVLESTQMEDISDGIITTIEDCSTAHIASLVATATKDTIVSKGEKEQRVVINRMKKNKNFTLAIGEDLQINTIVDTEKLAESKAKIKLEVKPGKVVISFVKGKLNGMNIYERLAGTIGWEKLAYNSYSPYEDKRPLAVAGVSEHREYMGIGVIHDAEVTLQSDIMEVIYGG